MQAYDMAYSTGGRQMKKVASNNVSKSPNQNDFYGFIKRPQTQTKFQRSNTPMTGIQAYQDATVLGTSPQPMLYYGGSCKHVA